MFTGKDHDHGTGLHLGDLASMGPGDVHREGLAQGGLVGIGYLALQWGPVMFTGKDR